MKNVGLHTRIRKNNIKSVILLILFPAVIFLLASVPEKMSKDPCIEAVNRKDVAQMFIDSPKEKQPNIRRFSLAGIFSTHPPVEKRIALLKQF